MTGWWYAEKEKKTGPVDADELTRLLQAGRVSLKTMVWKQGMDSWKPLEQMEELQESRASVPPPLPPKVGSDPLTYPLATRWPRFLARMFDVWWETLLVAIALGFVLGRYSASFVAWFERPGSSNLFSLMCIPVALLFDALIYRFAGNTPGKAMLALKVGTLDGKPLSFGQYLTRNLSMWFSGLALGFPLFNLFTMAWQSGRLGKGQQASYDESTGYRVRAKPIGGVRRTGFAFAFIGMFMVMALLNAMEQKENRKYELSQAQQNYSWENPTTSLSAQIDGRWKHTAQNNESGQPIHMFTDRADRAVVVFAVEQLPKRSIRDYVDAFQKGTSKNMRFVDGGRYFEREGRQHWHGSGSMTDPADSRLNVQVVQSGSAFWRVVTIQVMPYDYSEPFLPPLRNALLSTVK